MIDGNANNKKMELMVEKKLCLIYLVKHHEAAITQWRSFTKI